MTAESERCQLEYENELFGWSGPCTDGLSPESGRAEGDGGAFYEGTARADKLHGEGTEIRDGDRYTGEFRDGERVAGPPEPFGPNWIVAENQPCQLHKAKLQPGETVTWSGGCVDGKASGEGQYVWRHSEGEDIYEGGMREGRAQGRGIVTWADGDRYEGELAATKLDGRGIRTYADGGRYEGEFRDDWLFNEVIIWSDGDRSEMRNGEPMLAD